MSMEKLFEIAQNLKVAGFPQPEQIEVGQLWFNASTHEPIQITKDLNNELVTKITIYPTKTRSEIYAPTIEDFEKIMPKWGIKQEGFKKVCYTDAYPGIEYSGDSTLEARANAWKGENPA